MEDRNILDAQLGKVAYIQRQAAGAKVCFYYEETGAIPLFPDERPDVNAATVVLESGEAPDGGERMRVKVFTHRGRFFSIEFPKRPNRYMEVHGMRAASLKVDQVLLHQRPD